MQIKVSCPSCRKRARYSSEEAGLSAVCAACGTRFTIPLNLAAGQPEIPMATAVSTPVVGSRRWIWVATGGGILVGLLLGVAAVIAFYPRTVAPPVAAGGPGPVVPTTQPAAVVASAERVNSSASVRTSAEVPLNALASSDPTAVEISPAASRPTALNGRLGVPTGATPGSSAGFPNEGVSARQVRPPPRPITETPDTLSDEQIGSAITKGVAYLTAHLDLAKHQVKGIQDEKEGLSGGIDALVVYALIQSGQAISDPRLNVKNAFLKSLIDRMKQFPDQSGVVTYARSLRATALSVYNRPEDKAALRIDVNWLLKAVRKGAYGYDREQVVLGQHPQLSVDNSNSQYGLLGVWSAAEADPSNEVPSGYWSQVETHWNQSQLSTGIWPYRDAQIGGRDLSMTCAGVASLFVCHDWLVGPRFGSSDVGREPFSPNLKRGLDWLEQGNHAVDLEQAEFAGYTLYGIERVGLASGFKYFGTHDWYRELARQVLASQNQDGSWGRSGSFAFPPLPLIETSYTLLFLSRGRHPILMNKLRFDGYWANRPRDLSILSRYVSQQIEQPVNWQVVPLSNGWTDWMDCPILYMASHVAPKLTDADCDNLRSFIAAGGMLFTQADGDDPVFNGFVKQLAGRLFPSHPLVDVPAGHPIYSTVFKLEPKPKLQMVTNGARLLMLHSPVDLARSWQLREQVSHKAPFQFGVNLFEYASGKKTPRNRLDSSLIEPVDSKPEYSIPVARLSYKGNWDPEPYAWARYSRWFRRATGYGLNVQEIPAAELKPQSAKVAILTGADRWIPTKQEADAIRGFVTAGGVLLVDLCGGQGEFEENVRTHLFANAFPNIGWRSIPRSHPVLNEAAPGMEDLTSTRLRGYAIEQLGDSPGNFPSIFSAGQGHVIFTPLDITCGLLDTNTWGIIGYSPEYAQSLVKNILLWADDGEKEN